VSATLILHPQPAGRQRDCRRPVSVRRDRLLQSRRRHHAQRQRATSRGHHHLSRRRSGHRRGHRDPADRRRYRHTAEYRHERLDVHLGFRRLDRPRAVHVGGQCGPGRGRRSARGQWRALQAARGCRKPFVTHRSLPLTVACEMLGAAAAAEDVVQETWLRWADGGDAARVQVRDSRVPGLDGHPPGAQPAAYVGPAARGLRGGMAARAAADEPRHRRRRRARRALDKSCVAVRQIVESVVPKPRHAAVGRAPAFVVRRPGLVEMRASSR
jgi:hypothetical protein